MDRIVKIMIDRDAKIPWIDYNQVMFLLQSHAALR